MLSRKLIKLFPDIEFGKDCYLQDDSDGKGPYIKKWSRTEPEPTQKELDAVVVLDDSAWLAKIEADKQQTKQTMLDAIDSANTIAALKVIIKEIAGVA